MNIKQFRISDKLKLVLKSVKWEFLINGMTSLAALVSAVVAIITVTQMKEDRNAAYRPSILINPIQYEFSWNENGDIDWLNSSTKNNNIESDMQIVDEGIVSGNITIPVSMVADGAEQFTAVNVGVCSAKQVTFKWHESNINKLNDYLVQCDKTKEGFMKADKSIVFDYNGKIVGTGLPSGIALMYMLPEATETYDIPLPTAYYVLIQEIIRTGEYANDIPYLILSVDYMDIQEKKYTDVFLISIKKVLYTEETSGAGNAAFQLVPLYKY